MIRQSSRSLLKKSNKKSKKKLINYENAIKKSTSQKKFIANNKNSSKAQLPLADITNHSQSNSKSAFTPAKNIKKRNLHNPNNESKTSLTKLSKSASRVSNSIDPTNSFIKKSLIKTKNSCSKPKIPIPKPCQKIIDEDTYFSNKIDKMFTEILQKNLKTKFHGIEKIELTSDKKS